MPRNTTGQQDNIISAAEDFAVRNEAAAESINTLVGVIDELDNKISELYQAIEDLKAVRKQ